MRTRRPNHHQHPGMHGGWDQHVVAQTTPAPWQHGGWDQHVVAQTTTSTPACMVGGTNTWWLKPPPAPRHAWCVGPARGGSNHHQHPGMHGGWDQHMVAQTNTSTPACMVGGTNTWWLKPPPPHSSHPPPPPGGPLRCSNGANMPLKPRRATNSVKL